EALNVFLSRSTMSREAREQVNALVGHLFRHEAGRMLAALARLLGLANLDLAEEVVQDAMVQALRQWPFAGVPGNPRARLVQRARTNALEVLRRQTLLRRQQRDLDSQPAARPEPVSDELADDQLAMIFACCHPALPTEARIALTLKSVGGFGIAEIARAFLAQETAIAQRLVPPQRRAPPGHNAPRGPPHAQQAP